ncbi:MAG: hypothetical protein IPK55_13305 [Streptococcus sp.]|nr:hypothetical protein [Streptococcus sp.]
MQNKGSEIVKLETEGIALLPMFQYVEIDGNINNVGYMSIQDFNNFLLFRNQLIWEDFLRGFQEIQMFQPTINSKLTLEPSK